MHPVLKVAGVVHMWYYLALCTSFAQKFNGDIFRTKFHDSKSRSQTPMPILKEESSAHQSGNPWRLSEDDSRTPTTWPCRSWVSSSIKDYSKGNFTGVLHHFNRFSRQQVLQHPLESSIGSYRYYSSILYGLGPIEQINSHCSNSVPQFSFQDGQSCIGPNQAIQLVTHLPGSALQRFTYTGHLSSPGDFFPS
ncbi:hypothetical protein O181_087042 [Austropuccinia psidii MF-1]|uniref:Uncharacterized protein n=1 Tax=Austropuccinia psidii MF-1 TaxID=1389203 RepID=A0A9Q3P2F9_9BASI|nr:hypothetical protein [Austropuccinia psidii MF-1]